MDNIHIRNAAALENKISKFVSDGPDLMHVVADYDRTLTKSVIDGQKIPSAIALIRVGGYLTKDYPAKAFALHDEYNPIELDTSLPYDFRFSKMQEWWSRHEKLLIESGMNREVIDDILRKYPKVLRFGADNFFAMLEKNDIPILILSAGLGNIIEGHLGKIGKLTQNVYVVSNTFQFDANGKATGYKNKIIHLMNKAETAIADTSYINRIKNRKNILLLGDSIDDLDMVKNGNYESLISIGFLNEDAEKHLPEYISKFDVVITNDGGMEYVNGLLERIIRPGA